MESIPHLTPDNVDAVHEFFAQRYPSERFMKPFNWLCGKLFPVEPYYADAASPHDLNTAEAITNHVRRGGQLLIMGPHKKGVDPLEMASIMNCDPHIWPAPGHTNILAKDKLFKIPGVRRIITLAGALPVMPKQHTKLPDDPELATTVMAERKRGNDASVELSIARINQGYSLFIYPEGGRGKEAITKRLQRGFTNLGRKIINKEELPAPSDTVRELKRGIGRIACGVERPEDLMLVYVGIHYAPFRRGLRRKATAFVSHAYPPPASEEIVLELSKPKLQQASDNARLLAGNTSK